MSSSQCLSRFTARKMPLNLPGVSPVRRGFVNCCLITVLISFRESSVNVIGLASVELRLIVSTEKSFPVGASALVSFRSVPRYSLSGTRSASAISGSSADARRNDRKVFVISSILGISGPKRVRCATLAKTRYASFWASPNWRALNHSATALTAVIPSVRTLVSVSSASAAASSDLRAEPDDAWRTPATRSDKPRARSVVHEE